MFSKDSSFVSTSLASLIKKKKKQQLQNNSLLFLPVLLMLAMRTYVCCTTYVKRKYGTTRHPTFRVASCLQIRPYVTPTTNTSNVHLS